MARALLERVEQEGMWMLVYGEPGYPASLVAIAVSPAVLYGKGPLSGPERGAVAIIGSRKASPPPTGCVPRAVSARSWRARGSA